MADSIKNGGKIISAGNGGSMCDAQHFAEELSGRYRNDRPAYPAIAVCDPSHLTCVGNDYGFDYVFSRFLEGLGFKGDVFLGISTSGNSRNINRVLQGMQRQGTKIRSAFRQRRRQVKRCMRFADNRSAFWLCRPYSGSSYYDNSYYDPRN